MRVEVEDPRFLETVDTDAAMERLATGFEFVEGPLWHPIDGHLIFSDIIGDRMMRWSEREGVSVFRQPSRMANGNAYDSMGRLITCEHATSRVVRTERDGSLSVLASHFDGRELNSPNDVVVRRDDAIYFTDPDSGRKEPWGVPRERDLPFCGVYRLDPDGSLALLVDDFETPNGLCFSLDESRLFINDTKLRHIRVFDVLTDGSITAGSVWAELPGTGSDRPPDGMKLDSGGTLFCTGPGGIHLFDPVGTRLGVIVVEENVGNFTWGGRDLEMLFIAASTSMYRVRMRVPGLHAF
jgi:gluconolactonase